MYSDFFIPSFIAFLILSFVLGADSVGVVIGVLGTSFKFSYLVIVGSIGMVLGLLTWSYKVARTVGIDITDLSPTRGFSAYLSAGLVALGFLLFAIPVSITQTLIGAIMGVGLARGRLERTTLKEILFYWGVGLPSAVGLTALLGYVV